MSDISGYEDLLPAAPAQAAAPTFKPVQAAPVKLVSESLQPSQWQTEMANIQDNDPILAEYLAADPARMAPSPAAQAVGFHKDDGKPLDNSALGAATRGFTHSIIPAITGTAGAAFGSVFGGAGAIPAGIAGGLAGSSAQEMFSPPTAHSIQQAQLDEQNNKASRIAGEFLPALATLKPNLGSLLKAFSGDKSAQRAVALGTTLGAAVPATVSAVQGQPIDPARTIVSSLTGALMSPNKFGSYLFDKTARTTGSADEASRRVAAQSTNDVPAAIANLEGAGQLNQGGVRLLSGDVSGDPGLSSLQRAVTNRMDPTRKLFAQDQANAEAIGKNVGAATEPDGPLPSPPPEQAARFFEGENQAARAQTEAVNTAQRTTQEADALARRTASEQTLAGATTAAERAQASLTARQERIGEAAPTSVKADAGAVTKESLTAAKQAAKVPVEEAYRKAEERPDVVADFTNTHSAARAAMAEVGDTGNLPPIIQRISEVRAPGSADRPIGELRADLRNVNSDIREAAQAGKENHVRLLNQVKDGIVKDLEAVGEKVPELKAANTAYKGYAEKFKQGAAGDILKSGKNGADTAIPASETLERALRNSESAKQHAGNIGADPKAKTAVRDWYVSDLAAKTNGKPTAESVNRWMQKNAETLQHFPDVRKEVGQLSNRLANKSRKLGQMEADIEAAKASGKTLEGTLKADAQATEAAIRQRTAASEEAITTHPSSKFLGTDPQTAIDRVMGGGNVAKDMEKLLSQAGRDTSGAAKDSLRNGVKEWFNGQVRNTGKVNGADNAPDPVTGVELRVSLDKMNKLLKSGSESRKAVEQVFSADELRSLDLARKQIEVMNRKIGSPSGGSDTEFGRGSGDLAMESMNGLSLMEKVLSYKGQDGGPKGPVAAAWGDVWKWAKATWKGDYKRVASEILVDAMSDPQKAATLLRPASKKSVAATSDLLRGYTVTGESQKDKESPEERSAKLQEKFSK